MNKQEVIEKIKNIKGLAVSDKTVNYREVMVPMGEVLNIIDQLDEPEKPVVPKCVADWYEDYKGDLEFNIYNLCIEYRDNGQGVNKDLKKWFGNDSRTKPIETLVKMKLYGYEVEKEKLYTAQLKSTGEYLHYDKEADKIHHLHACGDMAKNSKHYHFTKDTLLKYNAWENDFYDVDEVKE